MNVSGILAALESHALRLGVFETVNTHELKAAPGRGLRAEIWNQSGGPVASGSGLRETTAVLLWQVRVRTNMLQEPQDRIDPDVMGAVDLLVAAYSGDFQLGGLIRNVDIFGAGGQGGLRWQAGYLTQDQGVYRIMDVFVPTIVNDAWVQVP